MLHRIVFFFRGLLTSPSTEVTVATLLGSSDLRCSLRTNLALVKDETRLDPWMTACKELRAAVDKADRVEIPERNGWRVAVLRKLLEAIQGLIESIVIN